MDRDVLEARTSDDSVGRGAAKDDRAALLDRVHREEELDRLVGRALEVLGRREGRRAAPHQHGNGELTRLDRDLDAKDPPPSDWRISELATGAVGPLPRIA
jgi:hypothetical protein